MLPLPLRSDFEAAMIRAVTFDYWNTLYIEDPAAEPRRQESRAAVVQAFFAAAGRKVAVENVRDALKAAAGEVDRLWAQEQRALSHGEMGEFIAQRLGFRIGFKEAEVLAEAVSSVTVQHPPVPADGAGEILGRLRGRAQLGLISDTGLTQGVHLRRVMANHGLAECFDHFTWSDQTLTTKPVARQFLYTLHMLGVQPDEAVHIGDLQKRDVQGAAAVGMRTILLSATPPVDGPAPDAVVARLADISATLLGWGMEI
jgi:FMN phosphatase YigB (HAD superfamily)